MLACYMPIIHTTVFFASLHRKAYEETYLSPWRKPHGCEFKLPLWKSLVDQQHAEVPSEVFSQEVPLKTSVQKPDLRILSLQIRFTVTFIYVHKTYLQSDLYYILMSLHLCHGSFVSSIVTSCWLTDRLMPVQESKSPLAIYLIPF